MGRKFSGQAGLEPLETRLCPTTFQYESLSAYLNINPVIADLSAPAGSDAINFGVSVSGVGDITGDGVPDFAIGADGVAPNGGFSAAGKVFLFSGSTRELIRTLSDGEIGFGRTMANLGDVNGDGVPDLAVGSPYRAAGTFTTGGVRAYSGADGSLLWEVDGDGPSGTLGRALATIADFDADQVGDLAVGGRVGSKGEVRILSGATGALITTLSGGDTNESFGSAVSSMPGILPHVAILAVGAPHDGNGKVHTYAADWSLAKTYSGQWTDGAFGFAVTMYGNSLVVGAPDAVLQRGTGAVVMIDLIGAFGFPDATETVEPTSPSDHLGISLADLSDVSGDGLRDLAIGQANGTGPGKVRIVSFQTDRHGGYLVNSVYLAMPSSFLGGALANVGDVDGDGVVDLLTGSARPGETTPGATLVSILPAVWGAPKSVVGASPSLRWMWPELVGEYGAGERRPYLIHDNRLVSLSAVPGLLNGDRAILGIADDASIAVVVNPKKSGSSILVYTYLRAGQRLTIDQAITSIVGGGLDTSLLTPAKVGAGGHILFNVAHPTIREAGTAWVLEPDGTLRLLWNGIAADVNASGSVAGTRYLPGDVNEPVVYSGGAVSVVQGVGGVLAINDAGDIAGWADGDEVVLVHAGLVTVVAHVNSAIPGHGPVVHFGIQRLDNAGRMFGYATFNAARYMLYYDPATGLEAPELDLLGATTIPFGSARGIDPAGTVVGTFYAISRVDPQVAFVAGAQDTWTVVSGSNGVQMVAINVYGQPVTFTRDGAGVWRARDARTQFEAAPEKPGLVAWVDPVDGLTYVVYITHWGGQYVTVMLRDGAGVLGAPGVWGIPDAFDSDLELFTSTDGLVHIAGRQADGRLVLMSRNRVDMADANAWSYSDLTGDHLAYQGMETPQWVGPTTTYVTPWNSQSIAGVDADGHVKVVWWSPGMTLWRMDDLSAIAGAPTLVGGITAFTTSWGGINIVGATASGDLTTIWWAPALGGQWLTSSLSEAAGSSIKLRAETLTSYVMAWGGLNVAGVDENGGVTIFWWSLESDRWTASTVTPDLSPVAPPAGPLSSGVTGAGAVHLGGVSAAGHVVDLSWAPGGSWELADLTDIAV